MEIIVIHRSITQRRVFLNCLRKTGYTDVRTFCDEQQALERLNSAPADLTIIQKELIAVPGTTVRRDELKSILDRSEHVIVASYQFTEHEVAKFSGTADELLLMPFVPELLETKVQALSN